MISQPRYRQQRKDRDRRDGRKILFYTIMFTFLVLALTLKRCLGPAYRHSTYIPVQREEGDSTFHWATAVRYYTAHARCRMDCRHITEQEVNDILGKGSVNIEKSTLNEPMCSQKYAIEGYSNENQHLRIVVSPCGNKLTIITCIDLNQEWSCPSCGDNSNKKATDE